MTEQNDHSSRPEQSADRRTPQRATLRRGQILEAARTLFNEHGTASVSTNRIAERAGVSPGNLYYWFRDKRAIVRALFDDWSQASEPPEAATGTATGPALEALITTAGNQAAVAARFAFFHRDLLALLHDDPELARAYRHNFRMRTARLSRLLESLMDAGLLLDLRGRVDLHDLVLLTWIASESAPGFMEVVAPQDEPTGPHAAIPALLRALLTPSGAQLLQTTEPQP